MTTVEYRTELLYEGLALQVDDLATRLHKLTMIVTGGLAMEARTIDFGGIGWAVNHMRHGHRLRRASWINKSLWVGYREEGNLDFAGQSVVTRPMLLMRQGDGTVGPYSPGQADLLAGDWEVVDAPQPGHTSHS